MTDATLREAADRAGMLIGAAYHAQAIHDDPRYGEVLGREFNAIVAENIMKFAALQPERGQFTFEQADAMLDFATAHAMKARGHALCWHHAVPAWLAEGSFTRAEALEILREHIMTVMTRYRGRVFAWDVVNEAVDDEQDAMRTAGPWIHTIGPDYIDHAFRWAHEADPDAQLFYNDYRLECIEGKYARVYALVRDLLAHGVPIHGVGLQFHTRADDTPTPTSVADKIASFNDLGLAVHITELDIKVPTELQPGDLEQQARVCGDLIRTARAARDCRAVVFWGFTDRYSWIPGFTRGACDHALPFDRDYRPKPAYFAMLDALR